MSGPWNSWMRNLLPSSPAEAPRAWDFDLTRRFRQPGGHGVTVDMRDVTREHPVTERETRPRDRRLAGKARRRARRAGKVYNERGLEVRS